MIYREESVKRHVLTQEGTSQNGRMAGVRVLLKTNVVWLLFSETEVMAG